MKHRALAILVAFLTAVWMQASCPCHEGGIAGLLGVAAGSATQTVCCHVDLDHHGDGPCPGHEPGSDGPASPCCCGGLPPQLPPPPAPTPPAPSVVVIAWLDADAALPSSANRERSVIHRNGSAAFDRASETLLRRHCALIV